MKYVRYHIRLYYYHDLDIISYMINYEFDVIRAIYCTLKAFTDDKTFVISIPQKKREQPLEKRRVYNRYLDLDPIEDEKSIELLNMLVRGKQNLFLKNLLRQYLCSPATSMYLKNVDDNLLFQEKFDIFKKDKKIVDADKFIPTNRGIKKKRKSTNNKDKIDRKSNQLENGLNETNKIILKSKEECSSPNVDKPLSNEKNTTFQKSNKPKEDNTSSLEQNIDNNEKDEITLAFKNLFS